MEVFEVSARVPMDVKYVPTWLTWVGSVTGCLRALGLQVDEADVAGMTGYAFVLSVHKELCPSGPTMFDWGTLDGGVNILGRSTVAFGCGDCHTGNFINERTRAHCRKAFELIAREVQEGRPCVFWGAYVPEFAIAVGVEKGSIIATSYKSARGEEEPPIPYDGIDAPGGPYVLAFPTPTAIPNAQVVGDRLAVGKAHQLLTGPSAFADYGFGLAGYEYWIKALQGSTASPWGAAYCAQCYAEGRGFARSFLARVASRNLGVAEAVSKGSAAFGRSAAALAEVAKLFPFPPHEELAEAARREQAIGFLKEARSADEQAAAALREAVHGSWEAQAATAEAG